MATVTFETGTGEKLPVIGPAVQHALIPLVSTGYYDPEWNRLAEVRVNGNGMTGDLVAAVTSATMSFSATQVGQMSLTFQDSETGTIVESGLLRSKGTIDFRNQHLEIRGIDMGAGAGGPVITVKGRSRVIGVLTSKPHIGKGSWGTQDVTAWVHARCGEAGAQPVVQKDLGRMLFTRTADDDTTWAMMQRAAAAIGAWCFEVENTIVFARPTWLGQRVRAGHWWDLQYTSTTNYSRGITGMPGYSWSAESGGSESLTFELYSADADLARPADGVTLSGNMGPAEGNWIVSQVDLPLTFTKTVQVGCVRIVDPERT